ncbi:MAG: hypothetical protein PHP86_06780 [Nevskiales bacterium]|nr:hypothetical protein [Nevskiales bacterium]
MKRTIGLGRSRACALLVWAVVAGLAACSKGQDTAPTAEQPAEFPMDEAPPVEAAPEPLETDDAAVEIPDEAIVEEAAAADFETALPDEVALDDLEPTAAGPDDPAVEPGGDRAGGDALAEYRVELAADEQMQIPGVSGELRVWIGRADHQPSFPEGLTRDATTLPAVGQSATVEPFAPAFEIEPAETQCIRIHPSGSEVRFVLKPRRSGIFNVGANVFLFDTADCSGTPIPKTTATLKVTVAVNREEIISEKAGELGTVFWAKLLDFWGAFVALLFALILFLIRGRMKKWFGFEGN